jgi:hypothetical protein
MNNSTSTNPNRHRLRGILAFLPPTVDCYSHDADAWKKDAAHHRPPSSKYRTRKRDVENSQNMTNKRSVATSTVDWLQDADVIAILVADPTRSHCWQVCRNLVPVCNAMSESASASKIRCLVILSSSDTELMDRFMHHTGFASCVGPSSALSMALSLDHLPTLAVLGKTGYKLSNAQHEELALEWNAPQVVTERWLAGTSALSTQQVLWAAALFPSCIIL